MDKEKESIQSKIGKRIKEIRIQKGIQAQEICAICNFEKSTYSRIEAGGTNPTIFTLWKIANALKVSLDYLVKIE